MFTSIRNIIFGAGLDGYSGVENDGGLANTLRTTPTEDEWLLVDDGTHSPPAPISADPMENLFIEHASMSVYGALKPRSAGKTSHESHSVCSTPADRTVVPVSSTSSKVWISKRSECNILRKASTQKARSSKRQTNKRGCQRMNQTSHYPKHVHHTAPRSAVFQPRR